MGDPVSVECQVDHQFEGGGPTEGKRRTTNLDRTEHGDFDGTTGHEEERSAMRPPGPEVGAEGFEPSLGTV
jgi:hypothetical protein